MANEMPTTKQDSRIHNYDVTKEDSLAHLDLGFKFYDLSDNLVLYAKDQQERRRQRRRWQQAGQRRWRGDGQGTNNKVADGVEGRAPEGTHGDEMSQRMEEEKRKRNGPVRAAVGVDRHRREVLPSETGRDASCTVKVERG
uniref:Uncharacterized protein n=1 Tax=Oryza punctata TaxID=4537 RepID=A0A0E0KNF6_ORYPU